MTVESYRAYAPSAWGQTHYRLARPAARDDAAEGAGQVPLLCLHLTPKSSWIYRNLICAMGRDRVAVAPDNPGYGASDGPDRPVDMTTFTGAIADLLDRLTEDGTLPPGPVDVLGYHTGSVMALELEKQRPDRVRRLIMTSLPVWTEAERAARRQRLAPIPLDREGEHILSMFRIVRDMADRRADLDWITASVTQNLRAGRRYTDAYGAVYDYDVIAALEALHKPLLVLNPEDDLWDATQRAKGMVRFQDVRFEDMPGVSHGLFDLDTDRIAALLRDFLDR